MPSKVNAAVAALALLATVAACTSKEQGKDATALREAQTCAAVAKAYVAAERDTITGALAAADKKSGPRPRVVFDPALLDELRQAADRLGCPPQTWFELFDTELSAAARAAGFDVPEHQFRLVSAQADDGRFDSHQGRVYMFSMFPAGSLTGREGAPADFADSDDWPEYVDEAGVTWVMWPGDYAILHQPRGAQDRPNKKFTAMDASGGSFEAVLMPDGATPTQPVAPPYTYTSGNWLTTGPLIGTYNYTHSPTDRWWAFPGHWLQDMYPHDEDEAYPEPPRELWVDPHGDWSTFVSRFQQVRAAVEGGAKVVRRPDGSLAIVADGQEDLPVGADLVALLKEWLASIGRKIEGTERPDPITALNQLLNSDVPVCGPQPGAGCFVLLRDAGGTAVIGLAYEFHYLEYFLLGFEAGEWRIAERYEPKLGDPAPVPTWIP